MLLMAPVLRPSGFFAVDRRSSFVSNDSLLMEYRLCGEDSPSFGLGHLPVEP
jgi:hypothetical protein